MFPYLFRLNCKQFFSLSQSIINYEILTRAILCYTHFGCQKSPYLIKVGDNESESKA